MLDSLHHSGIGLAAKGLSIPAPLSLSQIQGPPMEAGWCDSVAMQPITALWLVISGTTQGFLHHLGCTVIMAWWGVVAPSRGAALLPICCAPVIVSKPSFDLIQSTRRRVLVPKYTSRSSNAYPSYTMAMNLFYLNGFKDGKSGIGYGLCRPSLGGSPPRYS